MLEVHDLVKYYGQHRGIEDISFSLTKGTILGVLGHNGSGKTTLFRTLLGLIKPSSGYFNFEVETKEKLKLGYIPEERSMYLDISVKEHIEYLGKLRKMRKNEIEKQMRRWLTFFEMMHVQNRPIGTLSKGNQQKIQFICALIHDPQVLILDEPLNGLDGANIIQLKRAMMLLSKLGKIILLSSHQYEELEEFCHEIILLQKGRCVLQGNLNELRLAKKSRYVTINHDVSKQYMKELGVIDVQQSGEYTRYTLKDETSAQHFCHRRLQEKLSSYVRLEMITLRDLVMEATT